MTDKHETERAAAQSNDELQPLNCDRDPVRWAREFNDALQTIYPGIAPQRLDEGWLIGWFANAMMCGEDTYRWRQESTQSATGLMIHAAWRYRNKHTGAETLTHQPPDRVLFPDDYEITELFALDPLNATDSRSDCVEPVESRSEK